MSFDDLLGDVVQPLALCLAQIRLLVLRVRVQEKERHVQIMEEVNHSCSATFATSLKPPSQFAYAAGSLDDDTSSGVASQVIDQFSPLLFAH